MRILLKPGENLYIGFYDKKDEEDNMPLEHGLLDGQINVQFTETGAIIIYTDWPDNKGRKGILYEEDPVEPLDSLT